MVVCFPKKECPYVFYCLHGVALLTYNFWNNAMKKNVCILIIKKKKKCHVVV